MNRRDIEYALESISSYINTWEGKEEIKSIYKILSEIIKSAHPDVNEADYFTQRFINLIRELESNNYMEPVLLVLKNNQDLFDLYIFPKTIVVNFDEIISSEQLFAKIRKEKIKNGKVLPDIPFDCIFNFLKAYYIYRGKVEISNTSNNPAYNYNNQCLEMKSVTDLFLDTDSKRPVKISNMLIYSDDALPYSLDYLDDYIDSLSTRYHKQSFEHILKDVIKDKYLGSTLTKFYSSL